MITKILIGIIIINGIISNEMIIIDEGVVLAFALLMVGMAYGMISEVVGEAIRYRGEAIKKEMTLVSEYRRYYMNKSRKNILTNYKTYWGEVSMYLGAYEIIKKQILPLTTAQGKITPERYKIIK